MIATVFLGALGLGCGSASPGASRPEWVENHGGFASSVTAGRATRIGAALATETFRGHISLSVLNTQFIGGFAWPDGRIYVTRGLVELTSDDELAAAIAHEMGHLLADRGPPTLVALAGQSACDAGCEERADAIGCLLLRVKGRPAAAMITLLRKIAASPETDSNVRPSIERRIERLVAAGSG